jgi:hypothetical protein
VPTIRLLLLLCSTNAYDDAQQPQLAHCRHTRQAVCPYGTCAYRVHVQAKHSPSLPTAPDAEPTLGHDGLLDVDDLVYATSCTACQESHPATGSTCRCLHAAHLHWRTERGSRPLLWRDSYDMVPSCCVVSCGVQTVTATVATASTAHTMAVTAMGGAHDRSSPNASSDTIE